MAATLTFKLVVLAIGSATLDLATWAGVAEAMAVVEALADGCYGSDSIRSCRRSRAIDEAIDHDRDRGRYVAVAIRQRQP